MGRSSFSLIFSSSLIALLAFSSCGCSAGSKFDSRVTVSLPGRDFSQIRRMAVGTVSIAAAGDVNFGDQVTPYLLSSGIDYHWENVRGMLSEADLAFVNLECAISNRGSPVAGKEFTFRGPPDSVSGLKNAGVDVVSLANNHAKDYGTIALLDTMRYLAENEVSWCGAGRNIEEAYLPATLNVRGKDVAFLAYTSIVPGGWLATADEPGCATTWGEERFLTSIRRASENHDMVVVSIHWGVELSTAPGDDQVRLARKAIENGADLILGHHPHVVQGFEVYRNKLIAYSLGNFIFSPPREISSKTLILTTLLDKDGLVQAKIVPCVIRSTRPVVLTGARASEWLSVVKGYSNAFGTRMRVEGGYGFIDGSRTRSTGRDKA